MMKLFLVCAGAGRTEHGLASAKLAGQARLQLGPGQGGRQVAQRQQAAVRQAARARRLQVPPRLRQVRLRWAQG